MPRRRVQVEGGGLGPGVEAILREVGVPLAFSDQVIREAEAARHDGERERVDIPFVTVDPPGSRDLDQALHIERTGDGFRVSYAIADVASSVDPGSELDLEAHARGVTVYAPDARAPLYPTPFSEGSGSLLAERWRAALLWTIELDRSGVERGVDVRRALVRSVAQHTYEDLPAAVSGPLAEVGELRAAIERDRGGVSLRLPEQEVVADPEGGWSTRYRAPLANEDHNAQISLLAGMAAARLMLEAGTGILRVQDAPDERSFARLRLQARALGTEWRTESSYGEFIASLDSRDPRQAALMQEAAGIGRGARYEAFDGDPPADLANRFHFSIAADYAHATAPLRRLQDRYVAECCLAAVAGGRPPTWVTSGLSELPDLMREADRRASAVERGVVDLVETLVLSGREGESFDALVVEENILQLVEPAVRARVEGRCPEPGSEVSARLSAVDVARRTVRFEVV